MTSWFLVHRLKLFMLSLVIVATNTAVGMVLCSTIAALAGKIQSRSTIRSMLPLIANNASVLLDATALDSHLLRMARSGINSYCKHCGHKRLCHK